MKISNKKRDLLEELAILQQEEVTLDLKIGVVVEELIGENAPTREELIALLEA